MNCLLIYGFLLHFLSKDLCGCSTVLWNGWISVWEAFAIFWLCYKRRLAGMGSSGRSGVLFQRRVRVHWLQIAAEPFAGTLFHYYSMSSCFYSLFQSTCIWFYFFFFLRNTFRKKLFAIHTCEGKGKLFLGFCLIQNYSTVPEKKPAFSSGRTV